MVTISERQKILWHGKNSPNNDKWCEYIYPKWTFYPKNHQKFAGNLPKQN